VEAYRLANELREAEAEAEAQRQGDATKAAPRRSGESSPVANLRKKLGALREEMAEHTGTLTLIGIEDGKWREWVDAHPARADNSRDRNVAFGYCNADDLIETLGTYANAWNGEPLAAGDWDWIKSQAAPGDLKELAQLVVSMHEMAVDVPKLLSGLLEIAADATD
jgi:hypothetical protein